LGRHEDRSLGWILPIANGYFSHFDIGIYFLQDHPRHANMKLHPAIAYLIVLGAGLALLIALFHVQLTALGVDLRVLHVANGLLFVVSSMATIWMGKSLQRSGGTALLKALYGGFMIRFFLLAGAAFIYILSKRKQVNVPGLIGSAIFYILYLTVEIRSLRNVLKSNSSNA
jgi:hypothetical protein